MAATLLELRKGVLIHLNDLQDSALATGDRYKPVPLNSTINDVVNYYARQLDMFYQGYLHSEISINLVANQTVYPLGATFRSPVYQIRRTRADSLVDVPLWPRMTYESVISTVAVPNQDYYPSCELRGNSLVLSAPPSDAETAAIVVSFPKKMTVLVNDSDALDDQLYDAEDCIKLRTAIRMLRAKDVSGALKGISSYETELKASDASFFTQIGNRFVRPDQPIPTTDDAYD